MITDSPIVICESKSFFLNERNVLLQCDIISRPKAQVTWIINSKGTQLIVDDASKDDYVITTVVHESK